MEQRINLSIDGPGIALFSPGVTGDIPKGEDFLTKEFSQPEDIGRHVRAGDVTAFCTGSPGDFLLDCREGYPDEAAMEEYPVGLRLALEVRGGEVWVTDLFWLSQFPKQCPPEQIIRLADGFYHLTVLTKKPDSGVWGDDQRVLLYWNPLPEMPELMWRGAPLLLPKEEWG